MRNWRTRTRATNSTGCDASVTDADGTEKYDAADDAVYCHESGASVAGVDESAVAVVGT